MRIILAAIGFALLFASPAAAQDAFEKDVIETSAGGLEITFIGHGTLMMTFAGKTIHIDPFGKLADYAKLPKADVVLVTHHHGDHLDVDALDKVCTKETVVVLTETCAKKREGGIVMRNGDVRKIGGIEVEAVPAYNIEHKRENGEPYHPRGEGNGYILTFGATRVYVAGDTENTPEMKALKRIDCAFLPMNLPYTMTPEMVADAARALAPVVLYPYHYGDTDVTKLAALLEGEKGIEVRVRRLK
ncbi:MBL fold metallo-hydrolase [Candidatus Uhrbacteria bacterium]|nr:MBL fold metallo-hydrolase [Candidatus Uhrbacteria bacterium]